LKARNPKFKIVWSQFLLRILILFLIIIMFGFGFLLAKLFSTEKAISIDSPQSQSDFLNKTKNLLTQTKIPLKGSQRNRINILLLGMGGEGHSGQFLTDTIILASINPETHEASLISIPRDLYVNIPETRIYTKINGVYTYGIRNAESTPDSPISSIQKTVEEITGQPVDYYLTINFEGFKKIIDELGGIIIQVEKDIVDHSYPGPGRSYETFAIEKGTHLVNGDVALKYARVRHVPGGDFSRLERQQEIISAVKRRALNIGNFLNPIKINNLLSILGENLKTNISLSEIPAFLDLVNNVNTYEMDAVVLDAWSPDSLLAVSHVYLGGVRAFVLVPRTGNYQEIQKLSQNIFDLEKIKREQKEIASESAKIVLVSEKFSNRNQIKKVFKKMNYEIELEEDFELSRNCRKEILILANGSDKFYTLSDLATKFESEIDNSLTFSFPADIVLCLPAEKLETIENQINQNSADEFEDRQVLDENGNILYNEN